MTYYLSRYWLMRQVQYVARGKPERAYAKWLVLHFAWETLSRDIESGQGEKVLRYSCENDYDNEVLFPLRRALDGIFKVALMFFRFERGEGEEAKDISTFFQLAKLDQKFDKFWSSSKNRYRKKVEVYINRFTNALEKFEIAE